MSISKQKILIVGGGSGMGLALARRCIEAGAKVIIAGRGQDRLRQAREALGNPAGLET
ncbi:SDR family NAD(P)-dependent oxidoreductase, partial [Mesorhizobium sp. M7A.F.Ca.CA.002.15.1.1]